MDSSLITKKTSRLWSYKVIQSHEKNGILLELISSKFMDIICFLKTQNRDVIPPYIKPYIWSSLHVALDFSK